MMGSSQIAVFDLGMVLVEPVGLHEELAEILGVTRQQMAEVYDIHRRPYDTGLPDRDYWSRTLAELDLDVTRGVGRDHAPGRPAAGVPTGDGDGAAPPGAGVDLDVLLPRLVEADLAGWSTIRPDARRLLEDLGRADVPVVVLSNAPAALAVAASSFDWAGLVQQWFFSAPLGLTKPDPAVYAHVEQALAATPDQLWFIDDRPENVAAASLRGWHAHRWRSAAEAGRWLAESGLLPALPGEDAGS